MWYGTNMYQKHTLSKEYVNFNYLPPQKKWDFCSKAHPGAPYWSRPSLFSTYPTNNFLPDTPCRP